MGDRQLAQLNPLDLQASLAALLAGGMAASSVHRKYRVLRRLLQVAVDKGLLVRNPCDSVQPPRVDLNEMRFLTPSEVVAVASSMDAWFRPLIYTAVETGMRWSELVGLRRYGVDLLRGSIAVTEQLVYIGGSTAEGRPGRWVRQQPKTRAGVRSISISGFLAEELEQQAERSQPGRDGLVFVNMRGGPIGGSIFNKRHWQPARAAGSLSQAEEKTGRPLPCFARGGSTDRRSPLVRTQLWLQIGVPTGTSDVHERESKSEVTGDDYLDTMESSKPALTRAWPFQRVRRAPLLDLGRAPDLCCLQLGDEGSWLGKERAGALGLAP